MKRMTIFSIIVCFVSLLQVEGQKRLQDNDIRVDRNRPSVYISYEREGVRESSYVDESSERVWLRFHNNSKWKVGTCMWDYPNGTGGKYPDKIFYYEVKKIGRMETLKDVPIGNPRKGGCVLVFVKPGTSEVFSVPREHIADGLFIEVNFVYEWEVETDDLMSDLEPKHFVCFYSSDIPKRRNDAKKKHGWA